MDHKQVLAKLCRICGERAQTKKEKIKGYPIKKKDTYGDKIKQYLELDIKNDTDGQHPTHICNICYQRLINFGRNRAIEIKNKPRYIANALETNSIWTVHRDNNCTVCSLHQFQSKHKSNNRITFIDYKQRMEKSEYLFII